MELGSVGLLGELGNYWENWEFRELLVGLGSRRALEGTGGYWVNWDPRRGAEGGAPLGACARALRGRHRRRRGRALGPRGGVGGA